MFVFCMLLLEAKYKFVGITHQFNDCFMMMFCLFSIRAWQHSHLVLSTISLAIAINIKMSALLIVPGWMLTIAFERGIIISLASLVIILGL